MSIPDYIISRTVLEEHMHREHRDTPDRPRPHEPAPERPGRLTALRHDLSGALHALASRIEPRPAADPASSCSPGTAA